MRIPVSNALAFAVLMVVPAHAQTPILSPVPFLRPDGNIPIGMPDTGVYLDYKNAQAVVFYRSAARDTIRRLSIPLGSGIRTTVSSKVMSQGGDYLYIYSVTNDATASQGVSRLVLNDPALGQPVSVEPSTGVVPPNGKGEFRLIEKRRPGLIRAITRGEVSEVSLPPEITLETKADIMRLQRTSLIGNVALVFGPRFDAKTERTRVVREYRAAAELLLKLGQLDQNSPYMRNVLVALSAEDTSAELARLASTPQSAREVEFDQALRMALQ
jgi:hypothetical protein